ncbi:MAG: ABC transporter ATP-binding protein [Cyclobacteriaceae bacterium]|nr:ABC transporter ATP-binding protein [Cyclobacteriaceae bacterium]
MKKVIQTQNLSIGYKSGKHSKKILENINLDASEGEFIVLLGLNGSGKSTLIRTLAGIQPVLDGQVELGGEDITSMSDEHRARALSIVLTHNETTGMIRVRDMVGLGRYPHTNWMAVFSETDEQQVERALKLTSLEEIADSYFHELSDGQKQKTVIARAIAQDTDIIFLDEPTNHLDIGNKVEIMRLLLHLARNSGKTLIMSTHDIDLATRIADKAWVITREGAICSGIPEQFLLEGTLEQLFATEGYDLLSGELETGKMQGVNIFVEGIESGASITRRALKRVGYSWVEDRERADKIIHVGKLETRYFWEFEGEELDTLKKLLEKIKKV